MTRPTNTSPTTHEEPHSKKNTATQEPFVITIRSPKVPDKLHRLGDAYSGLRPWYVEAWSAINVTGAPCGVAHVIRDSEDRTFRLKRMHVDPVAEHDAIRDALYIACRIEWGELDDSELQGCDPSCLTRLRSLARRLRSHRNKWPVDQSPQSG